jgi:hypothetical protein
MNFLAVLYHLPTPIFTRRASGVYPFFTSGDGDFLGITAIRQSRIKAGRLDRNPDEHRIGNERPEPVGVDLYADHICTSTLKIPGFSSPE